PETAKPVAFLERLWREAEHRGRALVEVGEDTVAVEVQLAHRSDNEGPRPRVPLGSLFAAHLDEGARVAVAPDDFDRFASDPLFFLDLGAGAADALGNDAARLRPGLADAALLLRHL